MEQPKKLIAEFVFQSLSSNLQAGDFERMHKSIKKLSSDITEEVKHYLYKGLVVLEHTKHSSLFSNLGINKFGLKRLSFDFSVIILLFESGNYSLLVRVIENTFDRLEELETVYAKMLIAEIKIMSGDFHSALSDLSLVNIDVQETEIKSAMYKCISSIYRHLNLINEANEYIDKALEVSPNNYRYLFSKGYLYLHSSILTKNGKTNVEQAKEFFLQSLANDPNKWAVSHYHLALIYFSQYDNEYLKHLQECIRKFSSRDTPHDNINLAFAHILLNNNKKGLDVLRDSLAYIKREPIICALKNAYYVLNNTKNLLPQIKEGVSNYINILQNRINDYKVGYTFDRSDFPLRNISLNSKFVNAIVTFIDIRGFTAWSSSVNQTDLISISNFLNTFYSICVDHFKEHACFLKFEGDGIMTVSKLYGTNIHSMVKTINDVIRSCLDLIFDYSQTEYYSEKKMKLGLGIVAGQIIEIQMNQGSFDYVGTNVNLSARLCNLARPEGIIICDDFRINNNSLITNAIRYGCNRYSNMFIPQIAEGLKGIEFEKLSILKFGAEPSNLPLNVNGENDL